MNIWVEQESATYFVRVCSNAMRDIGMLPKDVAVVVPGKKSGHRGYCLGGG